MVVCNVDWDAMKKAGLSEGQKQIYEAFQTYGVKDYTVIHVPDEVVAKYKEGASREEFEEAAIEISKQIIEMGKGIGAGFYFMTPFNRVSLVKSILEYV